jgi:hypothetical protein
VKPGAFLLSPKHRRRYRRPEYRCLASPAPRRQLRRPALCVSQQHVPLGCRVTGRSGHVVQLLRTGGIVRAALRKFVDLIKLLDDPLLFGCRRNGKFFCRVGDCFRGFRRGGNVRRGDRQRRSPCRRERQIWPGLEKFLVLQVNQRNRPASKVYRTLAPLRSAADSVNTLVQVALSMMFLRPSSIPERRAEGYSAGRASSPALRNTLTLRQNTLPHPLRL